MFGGRQFDLPMHDLDGNSVAAEFNDFAKNRVLHTFANLDERNEFIGEKESFGSVWWNEANEVCTYEYL